MTGPFAMDSFVPSFHAIEEYFGISKAMMQYALSIFMFSAAIVTLFIGAISDSYGRRKIILFSLMGYTIASLCAIFAPNYTLFLVCRSLQGMFSIVGAIVGQAIVRDKLKGDDAIRLIAQLTIIFSIAPAAAPMIGGYLQLHFGWQSNFILMASFGTLLFIVCLFSLEESLKPENRLEFKPLSLVKTYGSIFTNWKFVITCIALSCGFAGVGMIITTANDFIIDIVKLKETSFGWVFVPFVVGLALGSVLNTKITGKLSVNEIIKYGMIALFISGIYFVSYSYFFKPSMPWAAIPIFLYSISNAFYAPSITYQTLEYVKGMNAMSSSALSFIRMMGFVVASSILTPLVFNNYIGMTWVIMGLILAQISIYIFIRNRIEAKA